MAEQLKIYKLEPYEDKLDSLHWEASTYKGPVVIRAATEERARMIATQVFGIAVEVKAQGQETAVNPWCKLLGLVKCQEMESDNGSEEAILEPPGYDDKLKEQKL